MNEGLNMIGLNMSNIFLPPSLSLQERTFETKKNTSYFPSKALFLRYSNLRIFGSCISGNLRFAIKCQIMKQVTHFTEYLEK